MSRRLSSHVIHHPDPAAGDRYASALKILASAIAEQLIEDARQEARSKLDAPYSIGEAESVLVRDEPTPSL